MQDLDQNIPQIFIPLLLIVGGICVYSTFSFFFFWFKQRDRKSYLVFSLLCFFGFLYLVINLKIYQNSSVDAVKSLLKLQSMVLSAFYLCFIWFISLISKQKNRLFVYIFTGIYICYFIGSIFLPWGMLYSGIEGIESYTLPWGEELNTLRFIIRPFTGTLGYFIAVAVYTFPLVMGFQRLRSDKLTGQILITTAIIFLLSLANDILIYINRINFIFLGELAFVLVIILFSIYLANAWSQLVMASKIGEIRYKSFFETAQDASLIASIDGHFIDCNQGMLELLKYDSKDELLKINVREHYADPKERSKIVEILSKEGILSKHKVLFKRKDGTIFPVQISLAAIYNENGEMTGIQGTIQDQTMQVEFDEKIIRLNQSLESRILERTRELKEAKELAEKSSKDLEFLQFAIDNTADTANLVDIKDGTIHYINKYGADKLGFRKDELIGKKIYAIDPDFKSVNWEQFSNELREGKTQLFESRHRKKDGSTFPVEVIAKFVKSVNDEMIISFSRDITERKMAEKKLREAIDEAEQANKAKSIFLANMSHEIRTPLNAIMGHSQILQRDKSIDVKQMSSIEAINRSGEHLLELINDILDMSKIEAGKIRLFPSSFRLKPMLMEIGDMFDFRIERKNLEFEISMDKDLPDVILADENRIRQVIINLLGNAVKFTEKGSIRLHSKLEGDHIQISIEDTGPGIHPDSIDSIFDAFEQSESRRRITEGTGLGLAISRNMARLMGGDIRVESSLGKGSTFIFTFEFRKGKKKEAEMKGSEKLVVSLKPGSREIKVLIVDDKTENRNVARLLIEPVGFKTMDAENGQQAIEIAESWKPDLILMDIVMPVMGGAEATQIIRKSKWGENIKILAISASALDEERAYVLKHGVDDFMKKPYKDYLLFEKIGKLLGVEYEYDQVEEYIQVNNVVENSTIDLGNIPEDMKKDLLQETKMGNIQELNLLLGKLNEIDAAAAAYLKKYVEEFELEKIRSILEQGK